MERTLNDRSRRAVLQSLGALGIAGGLGTVVATETERNGGYPPSAGRQPRRDEVGPDTSVETIIAGRTQNSITLNWGEPLDRPAYFSSGVSHYEIYVDEKQVDEFESPTGGRTPRSTPNPTYVSKTISGLEPDTDYRFRLLAVDEVGNKGEAIRIGARTLPTTPSPDTVPPTIPALNITSSETGPFDERASVELRWRQSHDTRTSVDHYNLYVDGSRHGSVPGDPSASEAVSEERGYVVLTLDDLEPGGTYEVAVTAVDTSGNETDRTDARCRYQFRTRMTDVRDCSSLDQTDSGTTSDLLQLDRSNTGYFERTDGEFTDARITRDGTTDVASVVFDLGRDEKRLERGALQYHLWRDRGEVALFTREYGGTWERRRLTPNTYARTGGWTSKKARVYNVDDEVKVELRGGPHDWAVQLGRFGVNWTSPSSSTMSTTASYKRDAFYAVRAKGTDHRDTSESIVVDTSNARYFERPDGSVHGTRLTRTSTDDAEIVYSEHTGSAPGSVSAEYHVHGEAGGNLEIHESTDDGQTWSVVDTETKTDGDTDAGWQHFVTKTTGFSADATDFKVVLSGGVEPWGLQLGALEY
jgi:hypothetical protein